MKIIVSLAFIIFAFLLSLIFIAEYVSGDTVLSDSIGPSKDIQANIMLTENKEVTILFKTNVESSSELLNISLVDPQKREFFWEKSFTPSDDTGKREAIIHQSVDSFSFTPKASGIYHIKINNADFQTDVKIVSGMMVPFKHPLYLPSLIVSFIIAFFGGLYNAKKEGRPISIISNNE
jgi:hypothetical protein